ncbi:hypothetical protein STAFG_8587 [Streptomyces afghaniensis 772]|uniref:Bacterial bifunctional deaminase-reductase C-terminal domain-containing protein n=1 Tax=Streptomyces afghaniensis 772 TaxID=1283301 RepID=S4MDF8_9ACTN|nr:hypothetical protein STAFG_8587 [Streptomyces afghaniensis 772]
MEHLELLYEKAGQPHFGLPAALATAYGGDLGFTPPCVYANFVRATPGHQWTPDHVCPQAAPAFAELRRNLRRPAQPELVVITASGDLPTEDPTLESGALVATTVEGARRLEGRLPPACTTLTPGEGAVLRLADVLAALHARGHTVVLTEGGPHLIGNLLGEGLLDELFLTTSPVLAGRADTVLGHRARTAQPGASRDRTFTSSSAA